MRKIAKIFIVLAAIVLIMTVFVACDLSLVLPAAPMNVRVVDNVLMWDGVAGSNGYIVRNGDSEHQTQSAQFELESITEEGIHLFSVRAIFNRRRQRQNSEWSEPVEFIRLSYFESIRADRQSTIEMAVYHLNDIINSPEASFETIEQAKAELVEIMWRAEKEFFIESLILALGFDDAFVSISAIAVNVIVEFQDDITYEIANQIVYLAMRETGRPAFQVRIIPVN